jgi:hypothetical protein
VAHQLGGLGGTVKVGNAADSAGETGDARALKGFPDALTDLLLRLHDVMKHRRLGDSLD